MSRRIVRLPLVQNWDCHACGDCCTDYVVPVTVSERKRIEQQGWTSLPEFRNIPLFKRTSPWWQIWRRAYQLNHRAGNRCIFLNDKKLCMIHEKFGFETKPLACRLYPYILVPAGEQWRVSMRFACPSATANRGRPLSSQIEDISGMAKEMETWGDSPQQTPLLHQPPPLFDRHKQLDWADLQRLINLLIATLRDPRDLFPRRMLRCLALMRMLQTAQMTDLQGSRFQEWLQVLSPAIDAEVPRSLDRWAAPGWIGRVLFRSSLALYLRKDSGVRMGVARRGRLALILATMKTVLGRGQVPQLQGGLPTQTFKEVEEPLGELQPASREALERYYEVKLDSLQFCGRTYYGMSVWEGFMALALTLPIIQWTARLFRHLGQPESIYKAISVVDENFGYHPLLGGSRQRLGQDILASRQELDRLIAWYGR